MSLYANRRLTKVEKAIAKEALLTGYDRGRRGQKCPSLKFIFWISRHVKVDTLKPEWSE